MSREDLIRPVQYDDTGIVGPGGQVMHQGSSSHSFTTDGLWFTDEDGNEVFYAGLVDPTKVSLYQEKFANTDEFKNLIKDYIDLETSESSDSTPDRAKVTTVAAGYYYHGERLYDKVRALSDPDTSMGAKANSAIYYNFPNLGYKGDSSFKYPVKYKSVSDCPLWADEKLNYNYKYEDTELDFVDIKSAPLFHVTNNTFWAPFYTTKTMDNPEVHYYIRYNSGYSQYKASNESSWTNITEAHGLFIALQGAGGGGGGGISQGSGVAGIGLGAGGGGSGAFLLVYVNLYKFAQDYPNGFMEITVGAGGAGSSGGNGSQTWYDGWSGGNTKIIIYYTSGNYTDGATARGGGGGSSWLKWDWLNGSDYYNDGGTAGTGSIQTAGRDYINRVCDIDGKKGGQGAFYSEYTAGIPTGTQTGYAAYSYGNTSRFDTHGFLDSTANPFIYYPTSENKKSDGTNYFYRGMATPTPTPAGTANYNSGGGGGAPSVLGGKSQPVGGGSWNRWGRGVGGYGGTGVANGFGAEYYAGQAGTDGIAYILTPYIYS